MMGEQTVDLGSLNLEQLNALKQQIEEDIQILSSSLQQLRVANNRFFDSKEALQAINLENKGKTVLIPLTGSVYAPAQLSDTSSVLVDVGTGYYVSKPISAAQEYTDRKIKLISEQTEKVQQALTIKRKNIESVLLVMQNKIAQMESVQDRKAISQ